MDDTLTLQLMVSGQPHVEIIEVDFLIVSIHSSAYNTILGRKSLNKIGVIVSMPHLLMKFPISKEYAKYKEINKWQGDVI